MKKSKKILSLMLALIMIMSAVPFVASAVDGFTIGGNTYSKISETEVSVLYARGKYVDGGVFQNISQITIPEKVTFDGKTYTVVRIGHRAFTEAENVVKIKLPDTIREIHPKAFKDCTSITTITIPKNVVNIFPNAFVGCKKLERIEVSYENDYYHSTDGVLYSNNRVVFYPEGKKNSEYRIESGIEAIGMEAFSANQNLKKLYIPTSVKKVYSKAFAESKITAIEYEGSIEQWNNVVIEENGNDILFDSSIVKYKVINSDNCSCDCHGSFIERFFFILFNTIARWFGGGVDTCACGAAH